jgi:hypothetical protein
MNRPYLRVALAASTLILAGLGGGCVAGAGADDVSEGPAAPVDNRRPAASEVPAVRFEPMDVFGTRFLVNGSTSPSAMTRMGTVTLAIVDAAVTSADFYDGGGIIGSVTAGQPTLSFHVDERQNGAHSYTALVRLGSQVAASVSVPLSIAIAGGSTGALEALFDGATFPGPIDAMTSRPDGSLVIAGQTTVNGRLSASFIDVGQQVHMNDAVVRESGWSAVALDPRTGLRALAGYAVNDRQRDAIVTVDAGFRAGYFGPRNAFHIEYDAAHLNDEALGIAVGSHDSSVVVVGYETRPGEGRIGWITKYDAVGNTLWTQRLVTDAKAPSLDAVVNAVAIDPGDDSVVVAGARVEHVLSGVSGGFLHLSWLEVPFVEKYAADGTLRWSKLDVPPGISHGEARSVALTANGDIVWSGCGLYGTSQSCTVEELSSAGTSRWRVNQGERGSILTAVDPFGAVYALVTFAVGPNAVPPPWNGFKLSPDGAFEWSAGEPTGSLLMFEPVGQRLLVAGDDPSRSGGYVYDLVP